MTTVQTTIGEATFAPEPHPHIAPFIQGKVLTSTLEAMQFGATGSKLSPDVAESVKLQVSGVLGAIIGSYEKFVAPGEVGPSGTARATATKPKGPSERCPTGLLYGRVQSGKTNAMIVLTAMAIDNGFRVVVVLTSDNVSLVKQTASRFQVLQGVTVKDSSAIGSWLANPAHIKASLAKGGLVLVTAKNSSHMDTFIEFLEGIGAGNFPALILDDEADQATLDTTVKPKSTAKKKGKEPPSLAGSKIYEHHLSMRDVLKHHVYLQVTATPYALWLQNLDHPLRPRFTKLLEPGVGYTGGEFFFKKETFDKELPPLAFVDPDEDDKLVDEHAAMPEGLEKAIGYFLVAAAAQGLADKTTQYGQQNFLCHTSFKKAEHGVAADKIRKYVQKLRDAIVENKPVGEVALSRGLTELARSVPELPPLEAIKGFLEWRLRNFEVFIINSEHDDLQLPPTMNFIVGGNILGRGMTIENLLVTYYLRSTKVAQMDTVLQHARMFGYRANAKPYLRVFLPQLQALRFLKIQQAEDSLRELQAEHPHQRIIPVRALKDLRPTRTNVLDTNTVNAYHPGEHIYPTLPYNGPHAAQRHEAAYDWFRKRFDVQPESSPSLLDISTDDVLEALQRLPYDEVNAGSWDPRAIESILKTSKDLFQGRAKLHTRMASRSTLSEGMMGSDELKKLRSQGVPVLALFVDRSGKLHLGNRKDKGDSLNLPFYVFPELVLPKSDAMPVHVFNDG
jgi:hypothetical protein